MRTVDILGHRVELYDSIEGLPILRFHKYSKMLLVDSGIGSDLADFDRHIEKVIRYMAANDTKQAAAELENLRQNVYFIQSGVSPRHLAFAVLVKSIDGRTCDDLSDEGLQRVVDTFSEAPNQVVTALLEAVKKKIDEELRLYFPQSFEDSTIKEYFDQLKERTQIVLRGIVTGEKTEEDAREIDRITAKLVTYFHPQTFTGPSSVEIQHDKQFENMCLILSQNLHVDPKRFTVLEFYNAFEYLKEESRKIKAKAKR